MRKRKKIKLQLGEVIDRGKKTISQTSTEVVTVIKLDGVTMSINTRHKTQ